MLPHSRCRLPRRRTFAYVVAALLLAELCLVQVTSAQAARPGDYRVVAHRGDPAPRQVENTIPALSRAVAQGATAVEADLSLTRDRRIVLMHDPTLDRTTTCRGRVSAYRLAAIRRHCRAESGAQIPTLRGLLEWAAHHRANLLLEVKTYGRVEWTVRDFRIVSRMLRREGMTNRVRFLSRRPVVLRRIEAASARNRTQYLAPGWRLAVRGARLADGVNVRAGVLTRARVRRLRSLGAEVIVRRTGLADDWRRARAVRAHGVVVTDVAAYADWRRR